MIHKITAALFVLFAYFQWNDPDYFIWIPIYLIVAIIVIAYDRGWRHTAVAALLCIGYAIGMLTYGGDVISWVENGTPSITGSMEAESPFIEFIREFFGLGICLIVLMVYTYLMYKETSRVQDNG